jgi:hypothetical protein
MNSVRGVSSEGFGRIRYHGEIRQRLDTDLQLRRFFEQETTEIPRFYSERLQRELGPMWDWLPQGALHHNPNAYLYAEQQQALIPLNGKMKSTSREPALALPAA